MTNVSRRRVLASGLAVGGFATGAAATGLTTSAWADPAPDTSPPGAVRVGRSDPRYPYLVSRGANIRFVGKPDHVHIVSTTQQVIEVAEQAVANGKRIAVRSGGHCFEDFVDNADVEAVIDMSTMTGVGFDEEMRAFTVDAGTLLSEVYTRLYLGWGVTVPAGSCVGVGAGGHILGGGYGSLSREHGLVVDHLYAVEVVVIDSDGKARSIVATRESDDPNHDLWWAHTGGGGGNFGIVTRYWLRSPEAKGDDPSKLLPRPPAEVLNFVLTWPWSSMDENSYTRLVKNHGAWHRANSDPDSKFTKLHSVLMLNDPSSEVILLAGTVHGDNAEDLRDEYVSAITDGVSAPHDSFGGREPWLNATLSSNLDEGEDARAKFKAGYLREAWSDEQSKIVYDALNEDGPSDRSSMSVWLVSYGGNASRVDPESTATAQRDSVLKAIYMGVWTDPDSDTANLERLRRVYADVYADTGGVPAPGKNNDGCFINYPDSDMADDKVNTSGVTWHELYYKDNYPRLQRVKAEWDPRNEFRHALSIRPPD